ncbi:MAG: hypothetical protein ACFCUU_14715 [Cyclobacteriaceae bacterium]
MEKDTYHLLKNIYQDDLYIIESVADVVNADLSLEASKSVESVIENKKPIAAEVKPIAAETKPIEEVKEKPEKQEMKEVIEVEEPLATYAQAIPESSQTSTYYTLIITKGRPNSDEEFLLKKILKASMLNLHEVKIVPDTLSDQEIEILTQPKSLDYVICFGTRQIPCIPNAPLNYQIIEINQKKYTMAHPLAAINIDNNKKGSLWKILQTMFGIEK